MAEHILIGLVSVVILGIGAQWLGWWLRVPAILPLLVFGLIAGPLTGFIDPDALLGDLLLPVVSLSVAVILFEGGLSLNIRELSGIGRTLWRLISLGALVTWALSTAAAYWLVDLDFGLAVLLGAILVVTGPTVIGPLLRLVRPSRTVGALLRWEGIVIDPVGAMFAVLVFEAIHIEEAQHATTLVALGIFKTMLIGSVCGLVGAGILLVLLWRYWIPDFLQSSFALMAVAGFFVFANELQAESGLFAVTVMGVVLANQRFVSVRHIIEFKENLRVLLISGLFVLLAARLQISDLTQLGLGGLGFLCVLLFVARPLAVVLSTLGSQLSWQERAFLAGVAPRGIVAAAVASIFALRFAEAGYAGAERLVSLTFLVIIGTVSVYGLAAAPLARWLKVAAPNPQGVLIAGAHAWARAIAASLQEVGFRVVLVDTNWANISAARMAGLPTHYGNILAEDTLDRIDMGGIGRLLALTPNDEVNALATLHFAEVFGRAEVYQLDPHSEDSPRKESLPHQLHGRLLFTQGMTYAALSERFTSGADVKKTTLSEEFDYESFLAQYDGSAVPLFVMNETENLTVCTIEQPPAPRPGQTLISVVSTVTEET